MKHFFKLLDPMAVMPFTLRCLSFFGLRDHHPWHFRLGMFLVLALITVPKIVFGYRNRIDLIIRGVSELLFDGLIDSRVIIFAFKRTEFEQLITILRREFNKGTITCDVFEVWLIKLSFFDSEYIELQLATQKNCGNFKSKDRQVLQEICSVRDAGSFVILLASSGAIRYNLVPPSA